MVWVQKEARQAVGVGGVRGNLGTAPLGLAERSGCGVTLASCAGD